MNPASWIWRPSFERQRDFNPPEQRAAQRTPPVGRLCARNRQNELVPCQSAKSRRRFEPVRLATIRAPLFMTTSTRAASYGSIEVTNSRLMRWERWILKKVVPRKRSSRSEIRDLQNK
jgi:hypothetical protein